MRWTGSSSPRGSLSSPSAARDRPRGRVGQWPHRGSGSAKPFVPLSSPRSCARLRIPWGGRGAHRPPAARMALPRAGLAPRGFRMIAPDLPGFGDSPALDKDPPTTEAYADAVAGLLRALGRGSGAVPGHSFGGY